MANKKISALPEKQNPSVNDIVPIVDTQNPTQPATQRTTIGAIIDLAGSSGSIGATGPAGPTGLRGATGPTGVAGPTGAIGATGIVGATGPSGLSGLSGATGATGIAGATGPSGLRGEPGYVGATGVTGATGPSGPQGSTGATGPAGPSGLIGATGLQGPAGDNSTFEFTVLYTGASPTAVTGLPSGWAYSIASNDITVTHNVNKTVKDVTYWGYTAALDVWRARYPTAANELTTADATKTTAFKIRVSNTVVGCDSGGTARIVCFF